MSGFRAGKVDRSRLGLSKHLAPTRAVNQLVDIKLEELASLGKKLILLDVDNTLVGWHSHDIPDSTRVWVAKLKEAGMQMCILSNTRKPARLQKLAAALDIPYLRGRFKPSRKMYRDAMRKYGTTEAETIMIGDQLFTDILGANRTGVDAIWVHPMTGNDFIGTKVSRMGEKLVRGRFHKAMEEELAIEGELVGGKPGGDVVGQFFKFAVVGGVSTAIDAGIVWILTFGVQLGGTSAFAPTIIKSISTTIAACNSFLLNRTWTFKVSGTGNRGKHASRFAVVTVIGLLLNVAIYSVVLRLLNGPNIALVPDASKKLHAGIGFVIATGIVMFWNFFAQKHWAFREKH